MNPSQFNCPACFQQYSENNPPRLLTMCGHTFCHHCIKSLITKKKDKGFKVKCPIDKTSMQMEKPNPSLFPKNIALITILNKPKSSTSYNQFLSVDEIPKIVHELQSKQFLEETESVEKKTKEDKEEIGKEGKCVQHGKNKQVYCVQDGQLICTDCALFSFHRSHEIRSIASLIKSQQQMISQLQQIIKNKHQIQHKYLNNQVQNQIFQLLDKKKSFILKQIQNFFINLLTRLQQKQKQITQILDIRVIEMADKIQKSIKKEFQNQQKYIQWYQQVQNILKTSSQGFLISENEKLKLLVRRKFHEDKIKQGKQIIKNIEFKQTLFIQNLQNELSCLKFINKNQEFNNLIDSIELCSGINQKISQIDLPKQKLQFRNKEEFLSNKQSPKEQEEDLLPCQSRKDICPEEDLLPCQSRKDIKFKQQVKNHQHHFYFNHQQVKLNWNHNQQSFPNFLQPNHLKDLNLLNFTTAIQNNPKGAIKKNDSLKSFSGLKLQQFKNKSALNYKQTQMSIKRPQTVYKNRNYQSVQKIRPQSMGISKSLVRSSISLQKSTGSKINSKRKNENKFIHQLLINQILEDSLQTVDLTGQQISFQELFHIVKAISQSQKVKNLKMMRIKLDDSFIEKCFGYLLNVQRVNMAQNKLSQDSVDKILQILRSQREYKLKYLNLGQNRIVQRKNRKLLQEFRKLEINIVF